MHSRPFLLTAPDVPNYLHRTHMEEVAKQIPRADAKWLGQASPNSRRTRLAIVSGRLAIPPRKLKVH